MSPEAESQALQRILLAHARRYPLMQVQDLIKLLHQAAMGSEHAAAGKADAGAWLSQEMQSLGEGPPEPLVDPISPGGEVVRVHLRPYVAAGGDPARLLAAFLRTADEFRPSTDRLREWGGSACQMAEAGRLPFAAADLHELLQSREVHGFGAAHHSRQYAAAYRPAYRVVAAAFLPSPLPQWGELRGSDPHPPVVTGEGTAAMECRPGCGACCIALSISSPIPGMPNGKPAGVRCVQLTANGLCALFGRPERPSICVRFRAEPEFCGSSANEALALMSALELTTRPGG